MAIVDDHPVVTEGLQNMLIDEDEIIEINLMNSGQEFLNHLESWIPDIVFLDINLPDIDGFELCKMINEAYPNISVIILTTYKKPNFVRKMLHLGASGYVIKNTDQEELKTAIEEVAKGNIFLSPAVSNMLAEDLANRKPTHSEFLPELTRRETQVLKLIADEYTTSEIADELHISSHTVESHRRNLLQKLDARNGAGLIRVAMEKGLIK